VVGIDTSALFVARIGVRNDNDLVWVGRAANYAAKLTEIPEDNTVFVTASLHKTERGLKIRRPEQGADVDASQMVPDG